MGVDALVLEESEEMELAVVLLPIGNDLRPLLALEQIARGKAIVDALQFLDDDTASAHVEMADL